MLMQTRAWYDRELQSPLVPPLALLPLALPLTAQSDERIAPLHNSVKPSEHLILTQSQVGLESSLVPPVALLPPIASLTARILGVIDHHHGEMGSFADTFKGIVLESHKDLDRYIRQEIGTRDSQIKEERGRVEKNTKLAKEQDIRMHELKLHFEEKENALRRKLENCQTHLGVSVHNMINEICLDEPCIGTSTPNPEIKVSPRRRASLSYLYWLGLEPSHVHWRSPRHFTWY